MLCFSPAPSDEFFGNLILSLELCPSVAQVEFYQLRVLIAWGQKKSAKISLNALDNRALGGLTQTRSTLCPIIF